MTYSVGGGLGFFLGFFCILELLTHITCQCKLPLKLGEGANIFWVGLGFLSFYCTRFIQKIHMAQF